MSKNLLKKTLPIALGVTLPILLISTACQQPGPSATGTPGPVGATGTPGPGATPRFEAGQDYTGQVVFGGSAPSAKQTIELRYPTSNSGSRVASVSTTVDGYFQIKGTTYASYQFIYDPATAEATTSTTNFTDLFVTDAIAKPKVGADNNTPGFKIEAGWALGPTPVLGAAVTKAASTTFKWTKTVAQTGVAAGPLEFQAYVTNVADATKNWASTYADVAEATWDFKTSGAADFPTGAAQWVVKWRTKDTTDGAKAFGQSQPMPFTIK